MFDHLRRWFALPVFDDEEKTRVARFMINFSWMAIVALIFLILARLFPWTGKITPTLGVLFAIILLLFVVQRIINLGHVRSASLFIVVCLWIAMTYLAWLADGLRDLALVAYIVIILLANLLLGTRVGLIVELLSIASIWYFAIAEQQGLRTPQGDTPINYARDLTGIFVLAGILIYLLINGWLKTLRSARVELKERLRAEEKLQRQADYLTALHETALGLLNRSELRPLLKSILVHACDLIGIENGVIELVLPDASALRQEMGHGVLSRFDGCLTLKGEGVTGMAWKNRRSYVVHDYASWANSIPEIVETGIKSVLGIPLIVEDSAIGAIAVGCTEDYRDFTQEQINLMERFAALAALAIHNARLNEQIQNELKERKEVEIDLRSSEERFRKVFDTGHVGICITSLDEGRFIDANNSFWELADLDPAAALGQSAYSFGLWKSEDEHKEFVADLTKNGSLKNVEYDFPISSGSQRNTLAFYELIHLKGELCVLAMFYDVTEQKQIQNALRESETRTRAILASIPDMIFEVGKDGTLLDFMASSEIRPLMSPDKFLGKTVQGLFPAHIADQTMFALGRALETGRVHAFEYGMPPGEEVQFFEARVAAMDSGSALIMVRDISPRKWMETEREKLINELEEKNAELERFTYTVSHDLKSPLITIKGFLGFLEQDVLSGNGVRLKADIKRISDAADKMQTLLSELLDLSRVGRLTNPNQYIPFEEIVHDAVDLVGGRLLNTNIRLHVQEHMPTIHGDRQRLVEVVQNLVDNAVKFIGKQAFPLIEIGQQGEEEHMPVFFVRDNGVGIEHEHQDRIFGLFNKLDADSEGTGIGLTLVKRIIEFHHGRIWVQSEPGKGATFFFTLPTEPTA